MDLKSLGPKVAGVLRDMGVSYDPYRLSEALRGRELDLTSRGTKVRGRSRHNARKDTVS